MNGTCPCCGKLEHFGLCSRAIREAAKPLPADTNLDTITAPGDYSFANPLTLADYAGLFNHPGRLIPNPAPEYFDGESRRGRCEDHPYSWHYTDQGSCEEFEKLLTGGMGFSELREHPDAMVALTAKVANQMRTASNDILRDTRAQLTTARENTRFWRRNAVWVSIVSLGWMVYGVGKSLGWF